MVKLINLFVELNINLFKNYFIFSKKNEPIICIIYPIATKNLSLPQYN